MKNCLHKFKIYKKVFTLAEVLITLVIVGVVAALTIPAVISKYKEQELVSRLKKTYSSLAQATSAIIAEEGSPRYWAISNSDVYNQYITRLNKVKSCGNEVGEACFTQKIYDLDSSDLRNWWDNDARYYKFILSDGAQVMVLDFNSDCTKSEFGTTGVCGSFQVDVNGAKKPNVLGRDNYRFNLTEKGLVPSGCDASDNYLSSHDPGGWYRACKVLRENAINY